VRVFVDLFGIPEDPATGSGNGCLAGYLSRYRYFGTDEVNARVEQGYEVRRRSLLLLKAENRAGTIWVHVGGKVVLVATGKLV
jgi:trans-2,3-dihydro-3-hydroxyanthranilate isomerase